MLSTMLTTSLLLLMMVTMSSTSASTNPVVDAPWGRVQGVEVSGLENRLMHGFLGIPYALPPVGDLRFEKPRPHPGPGEGQTFLADKNAPACLQERLLIGKGRQLSEDCLILDIYVPTLKKSTLRPVMFFIHGGGFIMGDSSYYRSSRLVVDEDVVVVVIQYRLGFFGFLSSSDGSLTPNLGLWDQNLALTWVRDNIAAFGGDPGLVTIFGESAGGMSVGLQTLSPKSKGLFKRAILQSGSPSPLLKISRPMSPELFANFSKALDCGDSSSSLACFKELAAEELQAKGTAFQQSIPHRMLSLPVVDGDFFHAQISDVLENEELMAQSSLEDVDTIIGFTDQEGSLVLFAQLFANLSDEAVRTRQFFDQNLYACLGILDLSPSPVLSKTTAFHYLGEDFEEDVVNVQATANLYGDCLLVAPSIEWALDLAANSRTASKTRHVYVMEHQFAYNQGGPLPGSHHGDDLALLFDVDQKLAHDTIFAMLNKTSLAEDEKPLAAMFARLFASFARTGTPELLSSGTGTWPQFTKESQQILSISATPRVVDNLGRYKARWLLWRRLLPQLHDLVSSQGQGQDHGASKKEEVSQKEEL